jgi:hypothetical protein
MMGLTDWHFDKETPEAERFGFGVPEIAELFIIVTKPTFLVAEEARYVLQVGYKSLHPYRDGPGRTTAASFPWDYEGWENDPDKLLTPSERLFVSGVIPEARYDAQGRPRPKDNSMPLRSLFFMRTLGHQLSDVQPNLDDTLEAMYHQGCFYQHEINPMEQRLYKKLAEGSRFSALLQECALNPSPSPSRIQYNLLV